MVVMIKVRFHFKKLITFSFYLIFFILGLTLLSNFSSLNFRKGFHGFVHFLKRSKSDFRFYTDTTSCSPVQNIAYLKVHKTASSTIQSILLRFGLKNNLHFAVPDIDNYFGKTIPFNSKMISKKFIGDFTINIFAIHTKWDFEEIKSVMPNDTLYIASVREPISVFESLFGYAELEKSTGMDIDEYVSRTPINTELFMGVKSWAFTGFNQMIWDFGLPDRELYNETSIENLINKADELFDLVLVAEKLDESLILLRHLLCWNYEDIVAFKVNARQNKFKMRMKSETVEILKDALFPDTLLYNHFKTKMEALLHQFGESKMAGELKKLQKAKAEVKKKCNLSKVINQKILIPQLTKPYSPKVNGFSGNLRDKDCFPFIATEDAVIDHIRRKQQIEVRKKFGFIKSIRDFLPLGSFPLTNQSMSNVHRFNKIRKIENDIH